MKAAIEAYCARIGQDSTLVQGAGGNVSWKDGDTLWIKASGTWLSEAMNKNIFVAVDLPHLQQNISSENFLVTPKLNCDTALRASIETLLHALMPSQIVLHLHAIEPLAHLVQKDFEKRFHELLDKNLRWTSIKYHKPGAALARAVWAALKREPDAKVIFLANHGVVIGASTLDEVDDILCHLTTSLAVCPRDFVSTQFTSHVIKLKETLSYLPISDIPVHQLAIDSFLFELLPTCWALYPDHVVFLGSQPFCYDDIDQACADLLDRNACPEIIFIRNIGVFAQPTLSLAKLIQLKCYYDVLSRQKNPQIINALNNEQVAELLNWEAEHYRMNLSKQA